MRAIAICSLFLLGSLLSAQSPQLKSDDGQNKKLGNVNNNQFDPDSVANPFGRYGSKFSTDSVNNPFGVYGSPYSPYSATNPYATQAPKIVTPSGTYLGQFSANPYAPKSTSNPYGVYGSEYSPKSINNPYGQYGNPYSPESATNPYGVGSFTMPSYSVPLTPQWSAPVIRPLPTFAPLAPLPALPALPALPSLPSLPAIE